MNESILVRWSDEVLSEVELEFFRKKFHSLQDQDLIEFWISLARMSSTSGTNAAWQNLLAVGKFAGPLLAKLYEQTPEVYSKYL